MLKRIIDIVVALIALVVLSPVFLVLVFLIRRKLGSPVFFVQTRPGKDGVPFDMIKFRSMTDARDAAGNLLPNEERLTPFGKKLRSTSLDELPELINVLKGQMSLVGPRPLRMKYLSRYSEFQNRRHEVSPGVTGWAQVKGRNSVSWEERFELDVWYVDNQNFVLDIRILFMTLRAVLLREGVTPEDENFMSEFMGSASENESNSTTR
ncbi:MAG: sugar transferase [Bacteroidota bacterium]